MPGTRRACGASGTWAAIPEQRSPVDFGFDEAVWSPRTADEVLWTMQSYFPKGEVTARPYAGDTKVPLEYQTIYSRKKGARAEPVGPYDAGFRAGFDRKITEWACDFMTRSKRGGQAVLRLPALHAGPHPADPRPASTRARPSGGTGPTS